MEVKESNVQHVVGNSMKKLYKNISRSVKKYSSRKGKFLTLKSKDKLKLKIRMISVIHLLVFKPPRKEHRPKSHKQTYKRRK